MKTILIILILLLVVAPIAALLTMSTNTVLSLAAPVKIIGVSPPVAVRMTNPHGVRRFSAYAEQNGARYLLFEQSTPAHRWWWRRHEPALTIAFEAGRNKAPNLKEGPARLVVEAVSDDFRGSADTASYDVTVVLTAPRVIADNAQHYVNGGGMELVTFTPSGSWSEAGVRIGKYTFRSFPLPGHADQRFAMFAYSWDLRPM